LTIDDSRLTNAAVAERPAPSMPAAGDGLLPGIAQSSIVNRPALGARVTAIITSHWLVDVYSAFIAPLLGVLEIRCKLHPAQTAWLLGIGSLASGLSQPLAAWVSDKVDSRIFAALGLGLAAVCLSCIGLADSYATLLPLYILGMIGSGIYHPIGAASMGQLAEQMSVGRRAMGISFFHAAGTFGGVVGSILVTRITIQPGGFDLLRWCLVPGVFGALALHLLIRKSSHRHQQHRALRFDDDEIGRRWRAVALLYLSNALRFTVNMAMIYLVLRWTQDLVSRTNPDMTPEQVALAATPINGNVNALLVVGMLIGGISAGALVRAGREKWPMILAPIAFAPCIALMPLASLWAGYALAVGSGIAFAAMVPVSISVAQRLLPHRTSLASGLMLGGAWALAFVGPRIAEWCLTTVGMSLTMAFMLTAAMLALSSAICLPLSTKLLHASTRLHHAF
jgi:FSR family fosmidomycin resistance protein-like MFS transporter